MTVNTTTTTTTRMVTKMTMKIKNLIVVVVAGFLASFMAMDCVSGFTTIHGRSPSPFHVHQQQQQQQRQSSQMHSPMSIHLQRQFQHQHQQHYIHPCLQNQRRSVSSIQTLGLFGLGTAEIAIIAVVGVFLLGPDQVSSALGKAVGRVRGEIPDGISDDLKKVPDELQGVATNIVSEFQKGVEEGETNARARNAKPMSPSSSSSSSSQDDDTSTTSSE